MVEIKSMISNVPFPDVGEMPPIDNSKPVSFKFKWTVHSKLYLEDARTKENNFNNWELRPNDYSEIFKKYCTNFEEYKEKGYGLLLYGKCGRGKTFASDCIYNWLKDKYNVCKTSLSTILILLQDEFNNPDRPYTKEKLLKDIKRLDLVIFDDLGNENLDSVWSKQVAFELFDTLYRNKVPFIISTNLEIPDLAKHLEIKGSYKIADRILSVCKDLNYDNLSNLRQLKKEKDFI